MCQWGERQGGADLSGARRRRVNDFDHVGTESERVPDQDVCGSKSGWGRSVHQVQFATRVKYTHAHGTLVSPVAKDGVLVRVVAVAQLDTRRPTCGRRARRTRLVALPTEQAKKRCLLQPRRWLASSRQTALPLPPPETARFPRRRRRKRKDGRNRSRSLRQLSCRSIRRRVFTRR